MPYGASESCKCGKCGSEFPHAKKLSEHIKMSHKMSSEDYTVSYLYDGKRPTCPVCGEQTRFKSILKGFSKFCKDHANLAMSQAGRRGGKSTAWNKGLTKETDERVKRQSAQLVGKGNPFYGKKHTPQARKKNANAHRLSFEDVKQRIVELNKNVDLLSTTYVDQNTPLKLKCRSCQTIDSVSLFNFQRCWTCQTCFPNASKPQLDVVGYVRSLGFAPVVSTRNVIPPYELDIWIPEKNVAIEYHGLYWHSGGKDGVVDKRRHRQKFIECKNKNIRLFQFFSDEWNYSQDICKSMISHSLGVTQVKLNARDCVLKQLTVKQTKPFLKENHIAGAVLAKYHVGLVHPKYGLVQVATIRVPVQKKWGSVIELARMASCVGIIVRGGASKLLKHIVSWSKQNGYKGLLSYAEQRYGNGGVYESCGLTHVGESLNNYWYTDGVKRFNRFKYRAQPGKTEKQVAEENSVRPVWGCGNGIYLLKWD